MIKVKVSGVPDDMRVSFCGYAYPRTVAEFEAILKAAGGDVKAGGKYNNDCVVIQCGDVELKVHAPYELDEKKQAPRPLTPKQRFLRRYAPEGWDA